MGESKNGPILAILLAVSGVFPLGSAYAQSQLQLYSTDMGGGHIPAPAGAASGAAFDVAVPRLQAILARLRAVQRLLASHDMPTHTHPDHTHPVVVAHCMPRTDADDDPTITAGCRAAGGWDTHDEDPEYWNTLALLGGPPDDDDDDDDGDGPDDDPIL